MLMKEEALWLSKSSVLSACLVSTLQLNVRLEITQNAQE
jgi:hypothetical protein